MPFYLPSTTRNWFRFRYRLPQRAVTAPVFPATLTRAEVFSISLMSSDSCIGASRQSPLDLNICPSHIASTAAPEHRAAQDGAASDLDDYGSKGSTVPQNEDSIVHEIVEWISLQERDWIWAAYQPRSPVICSGRVLCSSLLTRRSVGDSVTVIHDQVHHDIAGENFYKQGFRWESATPYRHTDARVLLHNIQRSGDIDPSRRILRPASASHSPEGPSFPS